MIFLKMGSQNIAQLCSARWHRKVCLLCLIPRRVSVLCWCSQYSTNTVVPLSHAPEVSNVTLWTKSTHVLQWRSHVGAIWNLIGLSAPAVLCHAMEIELDSIQAAQCDEVRCGALWRSTDVHKWTQLLFRAALRSCMTYSEPTLMGVMFVIYRRSVVFFFAPCRWRTSISLSCCHQSFSFVLDNVHMCYDEFFC